MKVYYIKKDSKMLSFRDSGGDIRVRVFDPSDTSKTQFRCPREKANSIWREKRSDGYKVIDQSEALDFLVIWQIARSKSLPRLPF